MGSDGLFEKVDGGRVSWEGGGEFLKYFVKNKFLWFFFFFFFLQAKRTTGDSL